MEAEPGQLVISADLLPSERHISSAAAPFRPALSAALGQVGCTVRGSRYTRPAIIWFAVLCICCAYQVLSRSPARELTYISAAAAAVCGVLLALCIGSASRIRITHDEHHVFVTVSRLVYGRPWWSSNWSCPRGQCLLAVLPVSLHTTGFVSMKWHGWMAAVVDGSRRPATRFIALAALPTRKDVECIASEVLACLPLEPAYELGRYRGRR